MAAGSQISMSGLLERQQKIVDELANRFTKIVVLAAGQRPEGDVTGQEAAAQTLQINVETQALIHAAEDFLSFTRQLKELWLFGTIRELGEGEEEDRGGMDKNAMKVKDLVEEAIQLNTGRAPTAEEKSVERRHLGLRGGELDSPRSEEAEEKSPPGEDGTKATGDTGSKAAEVDEDLEMS